MPPKTSAVMPSKTSVAPPEVSPASSDSRAQAHPRYDVMIKAAIVALKQRNGSSVIAIDKHINTHYTLPQASYKTFLKNTLNKLAEDGKLVKVKASFKLSESFKKPDKSKTKSKTKPLPSQRHNPISPRKTAVKQKATPKSRPAKKPVVATISAPPAATKAKPKKQATSAKHTTPKNVLAKKSATKKPRKQ